ncbi:hypothetical protein ABN09_11490 [Morganella morganii]|nr:hypothetical protein ABN09_11490 [Morganella morganii]
MSVARLFPDYAVRQDLVVMIVYLQISLKNNGYIEILLMLIKIYLVITMRSNLWKLLLYYL